MKTFLSHLLVLGLYFPLIASAGNGSGNVSSVHSVGIVTSTGNPVASVPFFSDSDSTSPTFWLVAGSSANAVTNDYYPFYRDGTAYSTPSNKRAYCKWVFGNSSTSNLGLQLVSSQASITFAQSAALTSPQYQCGADQRFCLFTTNQAANVPTPMTGGFVFGDGSHVTYAGFQSATSAQNYLLQMLCYEK